MVLILIVTSLSVTACGLLELRGQGDGGHSGNMERNIKAQLHLSEGVDAAALRVRLDGPVIVLEGFVESEEESEKVEGVVRKLYPNRPLRNSLDAR